LMEPRSATKSQTSHYTAGAGYDVSPEESNPQQGIDLPSPLTGHILFGLVPPMTGKKEDSNTGHTFIQTEGSGFQTLYTKYIGHASGFFVNFLWGLQTGMIGTSVASEKTGKALVEESSPSTTPKTGARVSWTTSGSGRPPARVGEPSPGADRRLCSVMRRGKPSP
jgi:hypothetical protein